MPSKSKKQHNFMEAIAHNPAFAKKVGVSQKVGQEYSKADKGKTFRKGGIMGLFKGKETYKEELAEGKAVKSGKLTPAQYAKGESKEKTAKKEPYKEELAEGKALKSGKVSPEKYAKEEGKEKKFAKGGTALKKYRFAEGGYMGGATFPNQQFPMQQQAPQNTMLNAPQAPGTPGMPYAANNQTAFKKGGAVKKMAMGGPMDPRIAMMAKKKAPRGVAPARGMMPAAAAPRGMMSPAAPQVTPTMPMKKGGKVKGQSPIQTKAKGGAKIVKMAKGGLTSSRGDGCAIRGKTRA